MIHKKVVFSYSDYEGLKDDSVNKKDFMILFGRLFSKCCLCKLVLRDINVEINGIDDVFRSITTG